MIARSQIKDASDEVRARAKKFHCFERGVVVYVRTEPEKHDRGVFFEGQRVACYSVEIGDTCAANTFGNVCCHAFAADRRKRINSKRRATIARKKFRVIAA